MLGAMQQAPQFGLQVIIYKGLASDLQTVFHLHKRFFN